MSVETEVVSVLKSVCANVFVDGAPAMATRPYVVYQRIGGASWRYVDNTPADLRNVMLQIKVWADGRMQADSMAQQIEDALCAALDIMAEPMAESDALHESDLSLYGTSQDFSVSGAR